MSIAALLEELKQAYLSAGLGCADGLLPPVDKTALDSLSHQLGLPLPRELRELYQAHGGQRDVHYGLSGLFGEHGLLTPREAAEHHQLYCETCMHDPMPVFPPAPGEWSGWVPQLIPFASWNAYDLCIDSSSGEVWEFIPNSGVIRHWPSIAAVIQEVLAAVRSAQGRDWRGSNNMDDKRFWSFIEFAWQAVGGKVEDRRKLARGKLSEERAEALFKSLDIFEVMAALERELDKLSAADLLAFDRTLEQKIHDLDRRDIHEHTDGSDDGFLYARGFIVIAGKGYYEAVIANPAIALPDLECEEMCYCSWHLYHEKFGEVPPSGISRESCSNEAGWPDLG